MNELECGQWYFERGTIPPLNLTTWVSVYNIIIGAGFGK